MKNSINNKVKALKEDAENQDEFMEKLAEIDEEGQLTDDMLEQISGGATAGIISPLIGTPTLGMVTQNPPATA